MSQRCFNGNQNIRVVKKGVENFNGTWKRSFHLQVAHDKGGIGVRYYPIVISYSSGNSIASWFACAILK